MKYGFETLTEFADESGISESMARRLLEMADAELIFDKRERDYTFSREDAYRAFQMLGQIKRARAIELLQ